MPSPSRRKPAASPRLPSDEELAAALRLLSAIAHDGRLRALIALSRLGPLSVSELLEHCGLEQSALSHQLRVLRDARLVSTERQGKSIVYSLADEHIAHIVEDAITHAGEPARRRRP